MRAEELVIFERIHKQVFSQHGRAKRFGQQGKVVAFLVTVAVCYILAYRKPLEVLWSRIKYQLRQEIAACLAFRRPCLKPAAFARIA